VELHQHPKKPYRTKARENNTSATISMNERSKIVSVEGSINSGKGYLFEALKSRFEGNNRTCFVSLPTETWFSLTDAQSNDIVNLNEVNPNRYGFEYHLYCLTTIYKEIKKALDSKQFSLVVTERSIYSCKAVFLSEAVDRNEISFLQHQIYNEVFNMYANELNLDGVVYLKTPPSVCLLLSQLNGESQQMEHLTSVCNAYDKWLDIISAVPQCLVSGADYHLRDRQVCVDRIKPLNSCSGSQVNKFTVFSIL
jgi:deoxyadenosine/deoxycytidine kinase